jgi:hypothetical protein
MAGKPPISVRRPTRPAGDVAHDPPLRISHAPVPNVDPNGPEALAFTMRGRISPTLPTLEEQRITGSSARTSISIASEELPEQLEVRNEGVSVVITTPRQDDIGGRRSGEQQTEEIPLISVKLPPEIGRRLAAVADRRGSKRTIVAIEVLTNPLRQLAAEHRAGRFPELPRIVSGTVRSSIAFALPQDLAADLDFVLKQRRAVRAQVITRLLVPAIEQVYAAEVARAKG